MLAFCNWPHQEGMVAVPEMPRFWMLSSSVLAGPNCMLRATLWQVLKPGVISAACTKLQEVKGLHDAHLERQWYDLQPLRVQGGRQGAHELPDIHHHLAHGYSPFGLVAFSRSMLCGFMGVISSSQELAPPANHPQLLLGHNTDQPSPIAAEI